MKALGKTGLILLFILFGFSGRAQLNSYKYVVVPTHFEDYRKSNQYQTSTVIKYLFTQLGIPAVYDTQQPTDLKLQPCLGAYVRLYDTSGMFLTRVRLQLVDCEGKIIVETLEGTSKSKDYKEAYKEALMDAFIAFQGINYAYAKPQNSPAAEQPQMSTQEAITEAKKLIASAAQDGATQNQVTKVEALVNSSSESLDDILYAQPTPNGFQLVDQVPSIRMILINTSKADTFLAVVNGDSKGTVFKSNGVWVYEYLEAGALKQEVLQIKF